MNRFLLFLAVLWLMSGCAALRNEVADGVQPVIATQELDSSELLDVAIVVFDSRELSSKEIRELGLSEEIREAEERYIPIHLKYTMQRTGHWGAVRVVPAESAAHVLVKGTITRSDGERLALDIKAFDAATHKWLTGCDNDRILKLPREIIRRGFVLEVLSLYIPGRVEADGELIYQVKDMKVALSEA